MPVVITGANGGVGRVLTGMLARQGAQLRVVVRDRSAVPPLRSSGAKVAVTELSDTSTLTTVMEGAHTVCHLAGGLDLPDDAAYLEANFETTTDALFAAREAGIKRFLFLSYPGASPEAPNAYLRAKGLAEEAIRSSGIGHVIIRSTHVYGPGQRWFEEIRAAANRPFAFVVGDGQQNLAPVFVDDLARVLVAADDRRDPVSGTFGLQGPDVVTADELTDLLAGRRRRKLHLGMRSLSLLTRAFRGGLSPTLLEILAADSLADAPDAAAEFDVPMRSLAQGLEISALVR
ncbi:MAG TPA: NAD(P)H-binding protein [Actinomycetota bacterium]|nr:NAD(P)H-binding protein [Actinomycetota bacterium]